MTPADSPGLPVEQLARMLLACAKDDPALLARSNSGPLIGREAEPRVPLGKPLPASRRPIATVALPLNLPPARKDPAIEELVSIAVACARRAEDALQHAREVSWVARRRMSLVAAVTGAGVLAASAAIVLERRPGDADTQLVAVASAMNGVTDMQKRTAAQIAEVRSDVAALREAPASGPAATAEHASTPAVERESAAPVAPGATSPVTSPGLARVDVATAQVTATPTQATPAQPEQATRSSAETEPATTVVNGPPPLPEPAQAQPAAMAEAPGVVLPVQPHRQGAAIEHHYRRPVRHVTYYRPRPGYALAQIVYGVRRNLYDLFH